MVMGLCPIPHILFCLNTKKDAKKVKAQAVFPKNYGSPGMRNTTDSKVDMQLSSILNN